jgi:hypothetical protein
MYNNYLRAGKGRIENSMLMFSFGKTSVLFSKDADLLLKFSALLK